MSFFLIYWIFVWVPACKVLPSCDHKPVKLKFLYYKQGYGFGSRPGFSFNPELLVSMVLPIEKNSEVSIRDVFLCKYQEISAIQSSTDLTNTDLMNFHRFDDYVLHTITNN